MNVGELVIGLRADVAQLQKDMTDAKSSVTGAMGDIKGAVETAKTALEALGVAATLNEFKTMISDVIEFKARLADLSTQTGIGVETLGALANVGKLSKTSLDDITAASAKLSKAVETQNEDSKGAAQAIAALGLNFAQFKSLRPEEQLQTVARAMAEFQDGTGKTAAAMLLFGKNGATLLPFLHELAEQTGLASRQTTEASRQAKEFEDNLTKLKIAGDAWKNSLADSILPTLVKFTAAALEAKNAGANILQSFALGAVDAAGSLPSTLESVRNKLDALKKKRDEITSDHATPWLQAILGDTREADLAAVNKQIDEMQRRLGILRSIQTREALDSGAGITDTRAGLRPPTLPKITGLDENTAKQRDTYNELLKLLQEKNAEQIKELTLGRQLTEGEKLQAKIEGDVAAGVLNLAGARRGLVDGYVREQIARDGLLKQAAQEKKDTDAALSSAAQRLATQKDEATLADRRNQEYGLTVEQLQKLASARDRETAAAIRADAINLRDFAGADKLRAIYLATADALDRATAARDAFAAKVENDRNNPLAGADRAVTGYLSDIKRAGDATEGAVANSLHGLEDTTVAVLRGNRGRDAVKAWVDGILTEMTRLLIVRPLLQSVFSGLGNGGVSSLFGGGLQALFSQTSAGSAGFGTGAAYGNLDIGGFLADGGPAEAGKTYVVGERGPEILRMGSQSGTVSPNTGAQLTYAPVIHIDARADQASVAQQTATAVQAGNRQMVELLRTRGVL